MPKPHRIAGIGEVLWDAFPEGERLGGATANVACHCAALGADALLVSCIGQDGRGHRARTFLEDHGVDVSALAVTPDHETGVVLVTVDAHGKPEYEIREGVAWDYIPWNPCLAETAHSLDAVCFGSLCQRNAASRDTIARFLAATRGDCLRVFDINLRQTYYSGEVIQDSLRRANALKLNDEELPYLAELANLQGSQEDILHGIRQQYDLRIVALTRGAEGSTMVTAEATSHRPAPRVEVVNTVGAGDAFTAAMILGLLERAPLDEINNRATQRAAYVCTQPGAVP